MRPAEELVSYCKEAEQQTPGLKIFIAGLEKHSDQSSTPPLKGTSYFDVFLVIGQHYKKYRITLGGDTDVSAISQKIETDLKKMIAEWPLKYPMI